MKNEEIFKGIEGYAEVKENLKIIIDMLNNPEKYQELGCDMIKGLLLWGPPGTGKTSLAYSILNSINCSNYIIRREGTDEQFDNILKLKFNEAIKNAPSIILLDDVDKFASTEFDNNVFYCLQSLIDEAKTSNVLVIATTNDKMRLPESLRRKGRFDEIIYISNPSEKDSYDIIKSYLQNKKIDNDINIDRVTNLIAGNSCAEIESVCKKAGILAGYKNQSTIKMDDIVNASLELIYGCNNELYDEDDISGNEMTAYHEAGHAIIGNYYNPGSIRFISISRSVYKRGVIVYHSSEKDDDMTESSEKAHLARVLGGKAATEVVFGEVDLGANSDLQKAFKIARAFADAYCANGFDSWFYSEQETSEMTKANLDTKASQMVRDYYIKAKEILMANRDLLDKLAKKLLKNKILYEDEINEILNKGGN